MQRFNLAKLCRIFLALTLLSVGLTSLIPTATAANLEATPPTTEQTKISVVGNFVSATDNNQTLHLDVTLNSRDQNGLDKFLQDLYTPGSPVFHHYLSTAQFQTLYGPSDAARTAVTSFLQNHNLQVSNNSKGFVIDATGSVSQVEQAFKLSINNYRDSSGRVFYANAQTPAIPSEIASYVKTIGGLSNNLHLHHTTINTDTDAISKDTPTQCSDATNAGGYTPNQFGPAYDFNQFYSHNISGSNQTVALFELADYDDNNISTYQNCFGLSTSIPISREIINTAPSPTDSYLGEVEAELDIEVILGMVPQLSKMVVYESKNDDLDSTVVDVYNQIATDDTAQVVSTSWGDCEANTTPFLANSENTIFQQMAAQGQSVFAAAGDNGVLDCRGDNSTNDNVVSVDDPGGQPYVTDVGGTNLYLTNTNTTYYTETVWSGSGGGLSTNWKQPFWQTGPGVSNAYSNGYREVPDVTIDANPSTGYTIYAVGAWITEGGTSASAPLWASLALLSNQYLEANSQPQLGFASPAIYQIFSKTYGQANSPFHDIVSGINNGGSGGQIYPATAGYDLASGVGSPDAWNLAQNLLSYVAPTSFYVSPNQLNFSGVAGNPNPAGQTLNISYVGSGNFTWQAAYSQSWLSLSQTSGTLTKTATSQNITATVNSTNLNAGVYTDTILFTSSNITETFIVPVTLTVQAAPTPTPTPTSTPTPPPNSAYIYYLPFLANNAGNFTTYLAIQNTGTAAANVSIQYYDSNGTNFSNDSCSSLATNAECLPGNKFATNQQGAGIITSDQPLNVIVAEGTPYGGSAYAVGKGWATTLVAPLAINQSAGFSTQIAVFNGGSSSVTATVAFYDGATGNHISVADRILTIQPHTSQLLDQTASGSGLTTGFYGWAQIVGASNSQLVAQVLEQNPSNHFVAIANAQTNPQPTLYAPAIFDGAFGGFVTGENLVNPNAVPVTVTINYQDSNGNSAGSKTQTIAAHALLPLFDGGAPNSTGNTGLPYQFYGSATISSTGGVVMVVNEIGPSLSSNSSESGTYAAVANGNSTVSLPVVAKGGFGYITGLTIQNTSNQAVNINVNYYDTSGTVQSVSQSFSIAPHASQPIYQGAVNLPSNFYGTAVITTTSGPSNALIVTTNALSPFDFYTYTEPIS